MTLSLFDQFMSPVYMGIPLLIPAIILPWIFFPKPTANLLSGRLLTLQGHIINRFTQQIFQSISPSGHKWAMLLTSLMLYITMLNILGLLPYTFTPTTQLSMNLALATPLWLATVIIGLRNQPTKAIGHLLPEGSPTPLIPILVVIETTSLLIRPIALGVRLTANLTAGHLLIQLVATATFTLLQLMPAVSLLTAILLLLLTTLEVTVAVIQAYVFVLLLSLYLQENL